MSHPKTICVDFDGVIHSYTSGWQGADNIPDEPVDGAIEGLYRLCSDPEIEVAIYSARSGQYNGINAMKVWLGEADEQYRIANNIPQENETLLQMVTFPESKPPAMCYIDDRAIPFDGDWSKITTSLKDFQPWNKREV